MGRVTCATEHSMYSRTRQEDESISNVLIYYSGKVTRDTLQYVLQYLYSTARKLIDERSIYTILNRIHSNDTLYVDHNLAMLHDPPQ